MNRAQRYAVVLFALAGALLAPAALGKPIDALSYLGLCCLIAAVTLQGLIERRAA